MTVDIHTLHQAGYLSDIAFYVAHAMADIAEEHSPLALLGAAMAVQHTEGGHVCLDLEGTAGRPIATADGVPLPGARFPALAEWLTALQRSSLTSDGSSSTPFVLDENGLLYLTRYWRYQESLAREIRKRAARRAAPEDPLLLETLLTQLFGETSAHEGDDLQRAAAYRAATGELTVITGGPGTGKTTTIIKIIALLVALAMERGERPPRISAMAPTGKAAARLEEALRLATGRAPIGDLPKQVISAMPKGAGTIHRALGTLRQKRPTDALLSSDLVVMDEASMVDLPLMHDLVTSIRSDCRLIIMGDKDQLASVESGAIMADLHDAASEGDSPLAACLASLTFSHRFQSHAGIGRLANAIQRGDAVQAIDTLLDDDPQTSLLDASTIEEMAFRLDQLITRFIIPALTAESPGARFSALRRLGVLTAHRKGELGHTGINRFIEGNLEKRGVIRRNGEWYAGRPIMITKNDYAAELYNGDLGLIVQQSEHEGDTRALFPGTGGDFREIPIPRLPPCETAFAMTIHKSQGSEFEHVAVILPKKRSQVITRELLYTAATRARASVTFLGPKQVIAEAVVTPTSRASGLRSRLLASSPPHPGGH